MAAREREASGCANPYVALLGEAFFALPAALQAAHGVELVAEGVLDVWRPTSRLECLIGDCLRLPAAGKQVSVCLTVSPGATGWVRWERAFSGMHLCSVQRARDGLLCEKMGPACFGFDVVAEGNRLIYTQRKFWVAGIPVAQLFAPRIGAVVSEGGAGWHVCVEVRWPLNRLLCRYEGGMTAL